MTLFRKFCILGLILSVLTGCGKNPVNPTKEKPSDDVIVSTYDSLTVSDSDSLATVIVYLENERENEP